MKHQYIFLEKTKNWSIIRWIRWIMWGIHKVVVSTWRYRKCREALYFKEFEIQCLCVSISSCWYYYFTILHTLWEWLYLSKKKPAVYSRTTDFLYYSFYLLRCVSDKFSIFKHNLFYFLICLKSFVTNKAFKRFSILWMSVWWCLFCVSISHRNNCYWFKVTWNIKLISDNLRIKICKPTRTKS